jgi:hypothetical protein
LPYCFGNGSRQDRIIELEGGIVKAAAPLFRFKQGDHICVFYEDENALLDFLIPYFEEGLRNGERCFCAQTPNMVERIRKRLTKNGAVDLSALELHSTDEVYFSTGAFAPVALMGLLKSSIAEATALGFKGIRMAGEMSFAANGLCECDQLLEYERLVEEAFPSHPVVGVCQYKISSFQPDVLECVLQHHRKSLTDTMLFSHHSSLAIRRGRYVIDVVADRVNPSNQFYYVAQEHGKKDILGWGVERNFDAAIAQGEYLLHSLQSEISQN